MLQVFSRLRPADQCNLDHKTKGDRYNTCNCQPNVQCEHHGNHQDHRHYGLNEIGHLMRDEYLDIFYILFQCISDCSCRITVQPAKRQSADMLGKLDPETVKDTECCKMRRHSPREHDE